jgi:hypothetical protein
LWSKSINKHKRNGDTFSEALRAPNTPKSILKVTKNANGQRPNRHTKSLRILT